MVDLVTLASENSVLILKRGNVHCDGLSFPLLLPTPTI